MKIVKHSDANLWPILDDLGKNLVQMMFEGVPIRQEFADRIGADGYAPDAGTAVRVGRRILAGDPTAGT